MWRIGREMFNWEIAKTLKAVVNFQQESGIPDKVVP